MDRLKGDRCSVGKFSRVLWSSADQGLASLSNLLLSVLVARVTSPAEFGIFAVAFTVYQFGLGSSRSFVGEPALIKLAHEASPESRSGGVVSSSVAVGFLGFAACAVGWIFTAGESPVFLIFALSFPVLMLTDGLRYYLFAVSRVRLATAIDFTWLAVQAVSYLALVTAGSNSVATVLVTWSFGALISAVFFSAALGIRPGYRQARSWITDVRGLAGRFWAEYLAISGVQQSVIYAASAFQGLVAAGAIRAAQVFVGPLSIMSMGVSVVALPELSRRAKEPSKPSGLLRVSIGASGALLGVTALYATVVFLIPPEVGSALLGESWTLGQTLLPLLLTQIAVGNATYGATAGIRALQEARLSLRLRYSTAPIALIAILIGATQSVSGALVGAIVGSIVQFASWWVAYCYLLKRLPEGTR